MRCRTRVCRRSRCGCAAIVPISSRRLDARQGDAGRSCCRRADCFPYQVRPPQTNLRDRIDAPIMRQEVAAETTEVSFLQFFYISLTACTPFYCPSISPARFRACFILGPGGNSAFLPDSRYFLVERGRLDPVETAAAVLEAGASILQYRCKFFRANGLWNWNALPVYVRKRG